MTLRDKIDLLKEHRKLNNRQLSLQSGIPYSTIDNWYKRASPDEMRVSTFRTLCDFFGVTMDSMAYDDKEIEYRADKELSITTEEAELVRGFRAAVPEIQDAMIGMSNSAIAQEKGRQVSDDTEATTQTVA